METISNFLAHFMIKLRKLCYTGSNVTKHVVSPLNGFQKIFDFRARSILINSQLCYFNYNWNFIIYLHKSGLL